MLVGYQQLSSPFRVIIWSGGGGFESWQEEKEENNEKLEGEIGIWSKEGLSLVRADINAVHGGSELRS